MTFAFLLLLARLAVPAPLTPCPAPQEPASPAAAPAAVDGDPARALFERLLVASGRVGREPLTAFQLQAEVLTRSGVQSNETRIDYRYLAPDCIRFMLPSHQETGRSGRAKKDYWLRSSDGTIILDGREYAEDRRQVDAMAALATNYVTLTDPARMDLRALELLEGPPSSLPRKYLKEARKLAWLTLVSPDFALVLRPDSGPAPELYRVAVGLGADDLPRFAVIRPEPGDGGPPWPGDALLVAFDNYQERSGFRIPLNLLVHGPDPERPTRFLAAPAQEIYVTQADLRPPLTPADFRP